MEPTHGTIELADDTSNGQDALAIPTEFLSILLPPLNCSVIDLVNFAIPTVDNPDTPVLNSSHFISATTQFNTPSNVKILRSQPVPSLAEIHALIPLVPGAIAQGQCCLMWPMESTLRLTPVPPQMNLPVWVLQYWETVHELWLHKKTWTMVQDWLEKKGWYASIYSTLSPVHWSQHLPNESGSTLDLVKFLSDSWLSDVQVTQMVAHLHSQKMDDQIWLMNNYWSNKLVVGYCKQERVLMKTGDALRGGSIQALAFPVFIRLGASAPELPSVEAPGNHWVAVVVDIAGQSIMYGDSLNHPAPNKLISAIRWWLSDWGTLSNDFGINDLPCGKQTDSESCGLYAINTLASYVTPIEISPFDKSFTPHRVHYGTFQKLVKYFNDIVSQCFYSQKRYRVVLILLKDPDLKLPVQQAIIPTTAPTTSQNTTIHPFFAPRTTASRKSSTKRKKEGMVNIRVKIRMIAENDERSDDDDADDDGSGDEDSGDDSEGNAPGKEILLLPAMERSGSAPQKAILNKLLQRCRYSNNPLTRSQYKCVGEGCNKVHANQNLQRALKHAIKCPSLPADLKVEVERIMVDKVPSSMVEKIQSTQTHAPIANAPITKNGTLDGHVQLGKKDRLRKRKAVLDLGVTKLFCVGNFAGLTADLPV
ncbi:hypothetical protein D9758_012823 [Tetrapyrgos nigripes]|uniref:Ubiquitin-like protease family profile domain-containing protein n=1 Tax=Tetrapyrgos nigripes TaxID=182062 RepID=A0A8H5FVI7_9AGAR|nr:hypothetical protein D9758_012823 [Tetrapyrgos nigripes]